MTDWRPMSQAPLDGTEIIGLGYPPSPSVNVKARGPDVRFMKAWTLSACSETLGVAHGWSARNGFGSYTVGFEPIAWMPKPGDPIRFTYV